MHLLGLPHSIGTICCLRLDSRIPPAAVMDDMISLNDRQTDPGDEWRQDEYVKPLVLAKLIEDALLVSAPVLRNPLARGVSPFTTRTGF